MLLICKEGYGLFPRIKQVSITILREVSDNLKQMRPWIQQEQSYAKELAKLSQILPRIILIYK